MIKVTNLFSRFDAIITNHVGSGTQILTLLDVPQRRFGRYLPLFSDGLRQAGGVLEYGCLVWRKEAV